MLVDDIYGCTVVNKHRRGGLRRVIYIRDPHVLSAATGIGAITSIFINHTCCLWNSLQFIDLDMLTEEKRVIVGSFIFFNFFFLHTFFCYTVIHWVCVCLHACINLHVK